MTAHRTGVVLAGVVLAAALGGCATDDGTSTAPTGDVPVTVALGRLPVPFSGGAPPPAPPTTPPAPEGSADGDDGDGSRGEAPEDGTVAARVGGNRALLIGDSVLASSAPRYGGAMCPTLNAYGWTVEIDAERGRFIEFGAEVLDARLRPDRGDDWDAVVVFLGNNFRGDVDDFVDRLDAMIERAAPRPVVLFTVSEIDARRVALNEAIRSRARAHPGVEVVDWAAITAADPSGLLADGLHLSKEGSDRLSLLTAATLGKDPPRSGPAACLDSPFTDDARG